MASFLKCLLLAAAAAAVSVHALQETDVVFHLYTRANPSISQPLIASWVSIVTSFFSVFSPTIITIHSNGESVSGNFNAFVVPAHLAAADVNVLAVDWSAGSAMYSQGVANAPQVGRIIASFANILWRDFGYNPTNIRVVGHGIGGHIAGIVARNFDIPPPHIIALDPSYFGWTHHPERLSADAAAVVEVLHTTAGTLGYDYALGDVDFYANGGTWQNACGADTSCSHMFAYIYYAESINRDVEGGDRFIGTSVAQMQEQDET